MQIRKEKQPSDSGQRSPPKWKVALRGKLIGNEKNLREALKNLREEENSQLVNYTEAERGILWIRYELELPAIGFEEGFRHPKIRLNIATNFFKTKVEGSSTTIAASIDKLLGVAEWEEIIRKQIEMRLKGWRTELKVLNIARKLVDAGKAIQIRRAHPASKHNDIEKQTDIVIVFEGNSGEEAMPLQVKSSVMGQDKHRKKKTKVPSILVWEDMQEDAVREKLSAILKGFKEGKILHI